MSEGCNHTKLVFGCSGCIKRRGKIYENELDSLIDQLIKVVNDLNNLADTCGTRTADKIEAIAETLDEIREGIANASETVQAQRYFSDLVRRIGRDSSAVDCPSKPSS